MKNFILIFCFILVACCSSSKQVTHPTFEWTEPELDRTEKLAPNQIYVHDAQLGLQPSTGISTITWVTEIPEVACDDWNWDAESFVRRNKALTERLEFKVSIMDSSWGELFSIHMDASRTTFGLTDDGIVYYVQADSGKVYKITVELSPAPEVQGVEF